MAQVAPRVNWCFTVNNYSQDDYDKLLNYHEAGYVIIGKEGKNGTPHLQGYMQLKTKKRITAMKKIHDKAHWEPANGTYDENKKYCSKEGDWEEQGNPTINGKKKVDMPKAVNQVLEGVSTADLLEEHGAGYVMNKRKIDEVADAIKAENRKKKFKEDYMGKFQTTQRNFRLYPMGNFVVDGNPACIAWVDYRWLFQPQNFEEHQSCD